MPFEMKYCAGRRQGIGIAIQHEALIGSDDNLTTNKTCLKIPEVVLFDCRESVGYTNYSANQSKLTLTKRATLGQITESNQQTKIINQLCNCCQLTNCWCPAMLRETTSREILQICLSHFMKPPNSLIPVHENVRNKLS